MKFLSFLLKRDSMGKTLGVHYKNKDSFPTRLGAILSISVKVMVLIKLVQKSIILLDMSDPSIHSYRRSFGLDE